MRAVSGEEEGSLTRSAARERESERERARAREKEREREGERHRGGGGGGGGRESVRERGEGEEETKGQEGRRDRIARKVRLLPLRVGASGRRYQSSARPWSNPCRAERPCVVPVLVRRLTVQGS